MSRPDLAHDPAVEHFVKTAKDYCWILENGIAPLNRDLVQRLLETILALYAAGLKLPEVDPEQRTDEDWVFDHDARQKFLKGVAERLNGDLYYQEMFEPLDLGVWEAVTGSLSD